MMCPWLLSNPLQRSLAIFLAALVVAALFFSCSESEAPTKSYLAVEETFGASLNLSSPDNYASQTIPAYITKDNTAGNRISNAKATLGRVLFYDKSLSLDNSVSCGSCHQQAFAFSDNAQASAGVSGGTTARHSMRLVNARFGTEVKFFWDERAISLEAQTTQPIQDHAEMGFSGRDGRPDLQALLTKLQSIDYYQELFDFAYGDKQITETRLQESMSQFVRSIQSFDSKYDAGRALVMNEPMPFPNFSQQENQGKNLFLAAPQFNLNGVRTGGGAGCGGCHRPPEFDIDPNSLNNGVIGAIAGGNDLIVTRSPSLRDVVKADGTANGPFMHTGASSQLMTVIDHYNQINLAGNNNLDPRLRPGGKPQNLNLTQQEKDAIVAFIRTLAGSAVYTDKKWSDPFVKN